MDLGDAKGAFLHILSSLDNRQLQPFLKYVEELITNYNDDHENSTSYIGVADEIMRKIKTDLKVLVPFSAVLPSENIVIPVCGEHADANETNTRHVDAFLYTDEEIDDLCDAGKLTRNYCIDCGSKNTAPLNFITHSMSHNQLKFIFLHVLTDLSGKTLLDVGSRVGAVLYGAYFYSKSVNIIGVEMNADFCNIQNRIIQTYQLANRIQVVCDDVCNQVQLLQNADVIVMHNVFEFFIPVDLRTKIWDHLRRTITKRGTVLVLSPSLEKSLQDLKVEFNPADWLVEDDVTSQRIRALASLECEECEIQSLHFYTVK